MCILGFKNQFSYVILTYKYLATYLNIEVSIFPSDFDDSGIFDVDTVCKIYEFGCETNFVKQRGNTAILTAIDFKPLAFKVIVREPKDILQNLHNIIHVVLKTI